MGLGSVGCGLVCNHEECTPPNIRLHKQKTHGAPLYMKEMLIIGKGRVCAIQVLDKDYVAPILQINDVIRGAKLETTNDMLYNRPMPMTLWKAVFCQCC